MTQFIALLFFLLFAGKAFLKEQQSNEFSQTTEINYSDKPDAKLSWNPFPIMQRLYF